MRPEYRTAYIELMRTKVAELVESSARLDPQIQRARQKILSTMSGFVGEFGALKLDENTYCTRDGKVVTAEQLETSMASQPSKDVI